MKYALCLFLVGAFTACTSSGGKNKNFAQFVDQAFEENLALSPQALTHFGRKTRYAELNDYTETFATKALALTRAQLTTLLTFDRAKLSAQDALTYDLFKRSLEEDIEDFQWRDYRYAVTQHGGIHSHLPSFMINKHSVANAEELTAYISRLNAFSRVFGEVMDQIKRSKALGVVPPKFIFSDVRKASRAVITGAPFNKGKDSPLWADFKAKLAKLNLPPDQSETFRQQGEQALLQSVKPAYDLFLNEFNKIESFATTDDGVWKFPRGDEYYKLRLRRATTTDLSADEIHQLGLKNVERLRQEMTAIKDQLGFKISLKQFLQRMRSDPKQYFPDTLAGRGAYLGLAKTYRDFISTKIPEYFRLIPKTAFEIRPVEEFREQSSGKAFYDRPSDDGSRPGVYYVNLRRMKDVPKFEAEALLYHEGIPGHHFQIALAIELKDLPKIRRYESYTAYSEGWGLYVERLGKEMGGYTDLYSELGRLSMEMLRAGRLVVDTGIHSKKWTRKKALQFFNENLPVSEGSQIEQIERYIVMPGQATAYMVGMLKILELRERAKTALGERFDIRDFHAVVLSNGAVPLETLESLVTDYVAKTLASK